MMIPLPLLWCAVGSNNIAVVLIPSNLMVDDGRASSTIVDNTADKLAGRVQRVGSGKGSRVFRAVQGLAAIFPEHYPRISLVCST